MTSNIPNKNNIICRWMEDKKFLVNPDKQVWPCCYLANEAYSFKMNNKDIKTAHPLMQEYYKNEKDLNLENNSIKDILSHNWYVDTLQQSWDGDEPHRLCNTMCSRFYED